MQNIQLNKSVKLKKPTIFFVVIICNQTSWDQKKKVASVLPVNAAKLYRLVFL